MAGANAITFKQMRKSAKRLAFFTQRNKLVLRKIDHYTGFQEKWQFNCFAENWQTSQKMVILTLIPV
jgi:hypothetical protein